MASVAYLDHHEFIESDPNKITVVATKISNTQGALKFTLNKPE